MSKQMKKVFSVEKFIDERKKAGRSEEEINRSVSSWGNECKGLTEKEMFEIGYSVSEDWLIEVE